MSGKIHSFLAKDVAVDLPSINAGAVGSATATVEGARAGDVVVCNVASTLNAGLVPVTAVVTADDTVTVYVLNTTGGALDAASQTMKFALLI